MRNLIFYPWIRVIVVFLLTFLEAYIVIVYFQYVIFQNGFFTLFDLPTIVIFISFFTGFVLLIITYLGASGEDPFAYLKIAIVMSFLLILGIKINEQYGYYGRLIFGCATILSLPYFYNNLHWHIILNQEVNYEVGRPSNEPQQKQFPPPPTKLPPIPHPPYIVSDPTLPTHINVENAIMRFKPSKRWQYEREYHNELYNWLSREFEVDYEVTIGFSRPDLVIENIAIEIKGPTSNQDLDTLPKKIFSYSSHYEYLIIVLFDCKFSDEKFNELERGKRKFSHPVKIIRK